MVAKTVPTTAQSIGLFLARLPVGVLFLLAGISKFTGGVEGFVSKALPGAPTYVPEHLVRSYLGALPYAEIVVGLLIILGLLARVVGVVSSAMIISFIMGATGVFVSKEVHLPHPNFAYLGVTLMLIFTGAGRFSIDALFWRRGRVTAVVEESKIEP